MIERNFVTKDILNQIDEINKNCIKMHIPCPPVIFLSLEVESPDGDIVHRHFEKANSFNRNFYNAFAMAFLPSPTTSSTFGEGYLNLKSTTSTMRTIASLTDLSVGFGTGVDGNLQSLGGSASDLNGICVGSSNTAESFEGNALSAKIAHGTGAGQLSYQSQSFGTASYNSELRKWSNTITRIFNNNSSGSINVNETCMISYGSFGTGSANNYIMFERNVLSSPVVVPAAYKLTVNYLTEITFPA